MATVQSHSEAPRHGGAIDHERLREDRLLFERFADKRDPVDREVLVERFLPLARSLAARYVRPGEPFDDIFQVACIGLVNAIDRYDLSRGRAFSSFAVPTIAGEIKRHYRHRTWGFACRGIFRSWRWPRIAPLASSRPSSSGNRRSCSWQSASRSAT